MAVDTVYLIVLQRCIAMKISIFAGVGFRNFILIFLITTKATINDIDARGWSQRVVNILTFLCNHYTIWEGWSSVWSTIKYHVFKGLPWHKMFRKTFTPFACRCSLNWHDKLVHKVAILNSKHRLPITFYVKRITNYYLINIKLLVYLPIEWNPTRNRKHNAVAFCWKFTCIVLFCPYVLSHLTLLAEYVRHWTGSSLVQIILIACWRRHLINHLTSNRR